MAVIDNAFETKGTHLFFIDNITDTDGIVTKLTCPTGITGLFGGTRDKVDTTCLDVTGAFRTNIGGFADPQEITVPFILYKGDGSHKALLALQQSGAVIGWMVGLSDSAAAPTMDSDQTTLTPPADRTSFTFAGYVSNVTLDVAINEVVRGTLTIQPSGFITPYWAA